MLGTNVNSYYPDFQTFDVGNIVPKRVFWSLNHNMQILLRVHAYL